MAAVSPKAPKALNRKQLQEKLVDAAIAKKAADDMKEEYDRLRGELLEEMDRVGVNTVTDIDDPRLAALGASKVEVKKTSKTTEEVDVAAYAELVTPEEFYASAKISVVEARKYTRDADYQKIVTKKDGIPYADVRITKAK